VSKQDLPPVSGDALRRAISRVVAPAQPTSQEDDMVRPSWYMARETAEKLNGLVTDLHFATRMPKHAVLAEMVEVLAAHVKEVKARLDKQ
jgi:hypothetical protein